MAKQTLIVLLPPEQAQALSGTQRFPAHRAYRLGKEGHLFRSSVLNARGGLMAVDGRGLEGPVDPAPFCQEILRECGARNFRGVVCLLGEGRTPQLCRTVQLLGDRLSHQKLTFYVPEQYAGCSSHARALVSSAVSGGSLEQRLRDVLGRYGQERVVLFLERRAEDFFLPSPTGSGQPLSREALRELMDRTQPSVFFSQELCARYFTYMSRESGAHFVLYDDGETLVKKMEVSQKLGVRWAMGMWEDLG